MIKPATCRYPQVDVCLFVCLLFFSCTLWGNVAQAMELIAHPSVTNKVVSVNEARSLFFMRKRAWSDDLPVTVFVLEDDSQFHRDFSKQRLRLFPYRLRRVWDRHLYSATGRIPKTVRNMTEMIKRISSTPGAIGYADKEFIDEGVQVIEIR